MDSRFITAALTATTTDRNTTSQQQHRQRTTTTPISHGSRWPIRLANATLPAFGPVR